jgi:4-hydroxythreonine-4-phosphate dehydrogenase
MTPLPLAVSTGDPGGVGPEISLIVALEARDTTPIVLFGDGAWLKRRALALGAAGGQLIELDASAKLDVPLGKLGIADVGASWSEAALKHAPSAAGGEAQLRALDLALAAAMSGRARALVTAPMSKAAVHLAGHDFIGHTEHLARAAGLADDDVTMMFLGPRLRVALVTTHISIASAPGEITQARVERAIEHLGDALVRGAASGHDKALKLTVTGLNPHAGEGGLFGDEETTAIAPAMERVRVREPFASGRVLLQGPSPAESTFRFAAAGTIDGVVAMLHDQATIASKLLDWGQAVNVTWGLPFVRTSVDHGVAYDAAEAGHADAEGMRSALRMALRLSG